MKSKTIFFLIVGFVLGASFGWLSANSFLAPRSPTVSHDHFVVEFSQLYLKYHRDPNSIYTEKLQAAIVPELKQLINVQNKENAALWKDSDLLKIAGADPYFVYFHKEGNPFMRASLQLENQGGSYLVSHLISQAHNSHEPLKILPQKRWLLQVPCPLSTKEFTSLSFKVEPHPFGDNLFEFILTSTEEENGSIEFQCLQTYFKIPWQKAQKLEEVDFYFKVPLSLGKTLLHPGSNSPSQKKMNLESELGLQLKETR